MPSVSMGEVSLTDVTRLQYHRVAGVGEMAPGEMRRRGRRPTVAIYNVDGEFFATCDTCSHEEASLAEGWLDDDIVTCPVARRRVLVRRRGARAATEPVATYPCASRATTSPDGAHTFPRACGQDEEDV